MSTFSGICSGDACTQTRRSSGTAAAGWLDRMSQFLNHDFCPSANKWVYWMKNPIWLLLATIAASVLCGIFVNPYVFLLTAVLALIVALGIVWPWIVSRGIQCRIEFEKSRTREGEPVSVRLHITNRWPWPAWGLSLERGFDDGTTATAGVALARIPGWTTGEFVWEFRPQRRGLYPHVSPAIETGFPFGLFRASQPVTIETQLIVWPRTVALNDMPDAAEVHPSEQRLTDRRVGEFGDMAGTRSFREGDSLRRVHWAQTARHRELIVCERQAAATTALCVVADVYAESHVISETESTLEQAIRVAASICESMHRQHAYVECCFGEDVFRCGANSNELRRLLDGFAKLPRTGLEKRDRTPHPRSGETSRGMLQIVVTTDRGQEQQAKVRHAGMNRFITIATVDPETEHSRGTTKPDAPFAATPEVQCDECRTWLRIAKTAELQRQLPRLWKRFCNAA